MTKTPKATVKARAVSAKAKAKALAKVKASPKSKAPAKVKAKANKAGRPPRFPSVAEFQKLGDSYFKNNKQPTMAGLCVHLKIIKQVLHDYEKRELYSDSIKGWRLRIEDKAEGNILYGDKNAAGSIFWLKNNANYADKQDLNMTGGLHVTIDTEESSVL